MNVTSSLMGCIQDMKRCILNVFFSECNTSIIENSMSTDLLEIVQKASPLESESLSNEADSVFPNELPAEQEKIELFVVAIKTIDLFVSKRTLMVGIFGIFFFLVFYYLIKLLPKISNSACVKFGTRSSAYTWIYSTGVIGVVYLCYVFYLLPFTL